MKRVVCSVWDSATQSFGSPIFVPHIGSAVRSFVDEVNRAAPDNQLFGHADDFELREIASFDDETGVFTATSVGAVIRGKDVKSNTTV